MMEPASALAVAALTALTPYLAKGSEEFIKAAGKDVYEKTKNLLVMLKTRWKNDREATDALTRYQEKPQRYEPVVKDILEEQLAKDNDFAAVLSSLLFEIGPQIEVRQRMKDAIDVTGLEATEMSRGDVKVAQEIDTATNVTGAKINHIG
jgi:hypothetical protein